MKKLTGGYGVKNFVSFRSSVVSCVHIVLLAEILAYCLSDLVATATIIAVLSSRHWLDFDFGCMYWVDYY